MTAAHLDKPSQSLRMKHAVHGFLSYADSISPVRRSMSIFWSGLFFTLLSLADLLRALRNKMSVYKLGRFVCLHLHKIHRGVVVQHCWRKIQVSFCLRKANQLSYLPTGQKDAVIQLQYYMWVLCCWTAWLVETKFVPCRVNGRANWPRHQCWIIQELHANVRVRFCTFLSRILLVAIPPITKDKESIRHDTSCFEWSYFPLDFS